MSEKFLPESGFSLWSYQFSATNGINNFISDLIFFLNLSLNQSFTQQKQNWLLEGKYLIKFLVSLSLRSGALSSSSSSSWAAKRSDSEADSVSGDDSLGSSSVIGSHCLGLGSLKTN